ncbi:MAG TPA: hypothetical protein VFK94_03110, partial [Patescibacteria group bacterium]|nr:hypothetical protein [Patescibacteria group bacterium]
MENLLNRPSIVGFAKKLTRRWLTVRVRTGILFGPKDITQKSLTISPLRPEGRRHEKVCEFCVMPSGIRRILALAIGAP